MTWHVFSLCMRAVSPTSREFSTLGSKSCIFIRPRMSDTRSFLTIACGCVCSAAMTAAKDIVLAMGVFGDADDDEAEGPDQADPPPFARGGWVLPTASTSKAEIAMCLVTVFVSVRVCKSSNWPVMCSRPKHHLHDVSSHAPCRMHFH